ncbi:MAG: dienelactone hydrolase family protein [Clostridia bacterium]|nr:dienelactone hydrolase family protein [Clostridia bacterium]
MNMIKKYLAILLVSLICSLCVGCGNIKPNPSDGEQYVFPTKENIVDDRQYYTGIDEIRFPNQLWSVTVCERATQYDRQDQGAQAYFLQSVDYNGAPTYVFAFVGIPPTATKDNPVPGVVLVHGGDGTAFPDWVKMWNDKGYAAIAIDTEGRIPTAGASLSSVSNFSFESVKHHAPNNASYSDYAKPVNEQFLYHAIAGTIVANTFLSSFEQVDSNKIGLTGISWGGVIATNVSAYDDRFAFVAPVYGAVAMTGTSGIFGTLYNTYPRCSFLWDNVEILRNCRTPMLFVNWERDPFFTVDATAKCASTAMYARMILIPELNHGHYQGANVQEIFTFANKVLQNGNK